MIFSLCVCVSQPGVTTHYVEMGSGPPVLLCHGFPESWFSWRFQVTNSLSQNDFFLPFVAIDLIYLKSFQLFHLINDFLSQNVHLLCKVFRFLSHNFDLYFTLLTF